MTGPELCVILGAPRSGTTWVQRLLAMSAEVATPQETHLFHLYLEPQFQAWRTQTDLLDANLAAVASASSVHGRLTGLPTLLDEDDLVDAQRRLVQTVLERASAGREGVRLIVEKSPSNSVSVPTIERLVPTARYVHVVRHPHAVMQSLRDASTSWGENWAPPDPRTAARRWRHHVEGARRAMVLAPDRYHEVRFEDLRADTPRELGRMMAFLGLAGDPRAMVEAERESTRREESVFVFKPELQERLDRLGAGEPADFHSRQSRPPLGALAVRAADLVTGDLARQLGYAMSEPAPRWTAGGWAAVLGGQTAWLRARRQIRRRVRERRSGERPPS